MCNIPPRTAIHFQDFYWTSARSHNVWKQDQMIHEHRATLSSSASELHIYINMLHRTEKKKDELDILQALPILM